MVKAVILAGGSGTRLRPLSCTRPKILFPIMNKPLLQWIFERLNNSNINEAILAVNHQTEFYIKQQRITKCGLNITYSLDPKKLALGTAGPIKKAEKLIGYEDFVVVMGDIFTDMSFRELVDYHRKTKATVTIALHRVEETSRYGVAEILENGRITKYVEKPTKGTAPSNLINAGVYVLSPAIFAHIPVGRAVSMEREVFPRLVEQGLLYGQVVNGLWMDIGEPKEYMQTNRMILDSVRDKQKQLCTNKFEIKLPVALDNGVSVGRKSVIGPYTILGKNVKVGKRVRIRDSVVFSDVRIGDLVSINGAIIGEGAEIGRNAKIGKGCLLGDYARVKENVSIAGETAACPAEEVVESIL